MDLSDEVDAYVSRLPLLATPSNSGSPDPPRLSTPPHVSDPSSRPSSGPTRRGGRRGGRAAPPYICTSSCQMNHRHNRPRSSRNGRPRRSSPHGSTRRASPPSSPRPEFVRPSFRGSVRHPTSRSTITRRPNFSTSRTQGISPPIHPLCPPRLVIVTISNNEVIDVASFAS